MDWPALRFHASQPLDWSGAAALTVPIENPGAVPVEILLRLDDRADATGDDRSLTGLATLPPQSTVTVVLPLAASRPGMRGQPPGAVAPRPGDLVMPDIRGGTDVSHIVALHVSGRRAEADRTLLIGTLGLRDADRALASPDAPLADTFGQAIRGDWPEKVASVADLRAKLAAAATETRREPGATPPFADRWGGLPGPRVPAAGSFQVAKVAGRWLLMTPAGHPFFSLGVDAVRPDNPTIVGGRESLFRDLPAAGSALALFYGAQAGRRTYDIGAANLARGLGPDWRALWRTQTVQRLAAWGFDTLGNWSVESLAPAMPHVTFTDVEGDSAMVPMGERTLVDPFDPRFAAVADAVTGAMAAAHADDIGLIGYFSGNELPWGEEDRPAEGIAAHVLQLGPDSPARAALVADLRARYRTATAFASAWNLPVGTDWTTPITLPPTLPTVARGDIARFEERFADRYFATVAAALKRHDPHHLYLGTRFAAATPAAVRACARWCDVLSFNVYGTSPAARSRLWHDLDRPVLIGEFHMGSLDRGSFWPGMTTVSHEADRGPAYAAYLTAAVADRAIVGVHWYQYADEPLTGRPYDGENGHIGLVAVTDVPFTGFVNAVAAANRAARATIAHQLGGPP